jgi:hypothetical protein
MEGDRLVADKLLGAYGVIQARLPNPDVDREMQSVNVPVQNASDLKSFIRTHLDKGVGDGSNELVMMYLHQKSLLSKKPSIVLAAFRKGVWDSFFEAVANYKSQEFTWPEALFLYQPTPMGPFKSNSNLFRK